ncbi:MAG: SDR family NAD(P)-dependent oxidoreductase, partial [Candidatus Zixiibacteriota bacterium]
MNFINKTVIVTGSARGIGRIIAEKFAAQDANVVISDLDQEQTDTVAGEISDGAGRAVGIKANVTKLDDIVSLFEKTRKEFGQIDIVVNNAGITRDTLMIRMDEKDWD